MNLLGRAADFNELTNRQLVYMLAVYHLEMHRIQYLDVSYIFKYLEDDRIYHTFQYTILETISELVRCHLMT
jgi:hypothetical protein